MDPSNHAYTWIRDFQYRHIETRQLQGWSWVEGKVLGVPESNQSRMENRDKNVMIKVHPGLSMWRTILGENIAKAGTDLKLDTVFIDVTLVTQNLHNCLVESMTSIEGLERAGGCDLNHFLFGKLCRTIGYSGLNGKTKDEVLRMQIHLDHSAIPTITIDSSDEIANPNSAIKRLLDMANS